VCGWAKGLLITGNPRGHDLNARRRWTEIVTAEKAMAGMKKCHA